MLKKSIFLIIAFLVIGLTVVQAQTAQQQRELEQIAMRSMNGLSAQDRQRVIQIMTDVYVSQGMSRTQAAQFAEMAADNMFSDYQEDAQSAEARRRVEASEQQQQRQLEERNRNLAELEQRQQPGDIAGWPSAAMFREYGHERLNLRQPAGTTASYSTARAFEIFLTGSNATTVIQDLVSQIERAFNVRAQVNNGRYRLQYIQFGGGNGANVDIMQENGAVRIYLYHTAG